MNNELLPCPFCGGEAQIRIFNRDMYFSVQCQSCMAEAKWQGTPEYAAAAWNQRTLVTAAQIALPKVSAKKEKAKKERENE